MTLYKINNCKIILENVVCFKYGDCLIDYNDMEEADDLIVFFIGNNTPVNIGAVKQKDVVFFEQKLKDLKVEIKEIK